jgi:hypothetical protein
MTGKEISKTVKYSGPLPADEIPHLFEMLLECQRESELTKREMKKFDSMKEVMIQEITGKYAFYEFLFSKIFDERKEAIQKDFQIIDEGIKKNNRDLIATGVSGLSQVVASSPIADMDKLRHMLGH